MNTLKKLVSLTVAVAASFIGVKEVPLGSNRGPQVTLFLNSIGLSGGYPWCAAFVWYCVQKAASNLSLANPFIRSGGCVVFERWARQKGILKSEPVAGDVFLSYSIPSGESRRRASHTGFVIAVDKKKRTFTTIEGNTNLAGSREGIGVFKRTREFSDRYKFIRWNDVVKEARVAVQPKPAHVNTRVESPFKVYLNNKLIFEAPAIDGRVWMPLSTWCAKLGVTWGYDVEFQVVTIQGREAALDTRTIVEESRKVVPTAPIRQLVKFSALKMVMDQKKREIYITRN